MYRLLSLSQVVRRRGLATRSDSRRLVLFSTSCARSSIKNLGSPPGLSGSGMAPATKKYRLRCREAQRAASWALSIVGSCTGGTSSRLIAASRALAVSHSAGAVRAPPATAAAGAAAPVATGAAPSPLDAIPSLAHRGAAAEPEPPTRSTPSSSSMASCTPLLVPASLPTTPTTCPTSPRGTSPVRHRCSFASSMCTSPPACASGAPATPTVSLAPPLPASCPVSCAPSLANAAARCPSTPGSLCTPPCPSDSGLCCCCCCCCCCRAKLTGSRAVGGSTRPMASSRSGRLRSLR
mmetsp:Transcript_26406/g.68137  ORF Transcript_26406/g.68137 Transcript_26406/m.68137 type:complete len:294 (+) Transcript_26406:953-1834(+)